MSIYVAVNYELMEITNHDVRGGDTIEIGSKIAGPYCCEMGAREDIGISGMSCPCAEIEQAEIEKNRKIFLAKAPTEDARTDDVPF